MTEPSGLEPALVENPVVSTAPVPAESTPAVVDAPVKAPDEDPVQKRIDKLTREKRELEWDRNRWREQAARQTPAQPETATPEAPKKTPTLEDFNYDESAYQTALTAHVTAEAARQVREEFRKEQEQLTQKQKHEAWEKRQAEFAAKTPDYIEKAHYVRLSDVMADIIKDSEKGPEIAYYLGKNPDESSAIAAMSERQAAVALGRIEAKLDVAPAPAPVPKPVSKAPPPPPKIEASEPAITKSWNDPSLSQEEFNRRRKQVISQRR